MSKSIDKRDEAFSVEDTLKLALEALEKCDSALAEELAAWDIDPPLHHVQEASNACAPAIAAIREALAQSRSDVEHPAQEQEPVAWANPNDLKNFDMKVRTNGGPLHTVPLYTSQQPSKPWVGLTDDEFGELWYRFSYMELMRAIENKLRERNT